MSRGPLTEAGGPRGLGLSDRAPGACQSPVPPSDDVDDAGNLAADTQKTGSCWGRVSSEVKAQARCVWCQEPGRPPAGRAGRAGSGLGLGLLPLLPHGSHAVLWGEPVLRGRLLHRTHQLLGRWRGLAAALSEVAQARQQGRKHIGDKQHQEVHKVDEELEQRGCR